MLHYSIACQSDDAIQPQLFAMTQTQLYNVPTHSFFRLEDCLDPSISFFYFQLQFPLYFVHRQHVAFLILSSLHIAQVFLLSLKLFHRDLKPI